MEHFSQKFANKRVELGSKNVIAISLHKRGGSRAGGAWNKIFSWRGEHFLWRARPHLADPKNLQSFKVFHIRQNSEPEPYQLTMTVRGGSMSGTRTWTGTPGDYRQMLFSTDALIVNSTDLFDAAADRQQFTVTFSFSSSS
jgi:hypothetical protein